MKILKSIILGLALLIVYQTAKAAPYTKDENLTRVFAINTYVDAMTHGKLRGLDDVVDQNAKFSQLRGAEVLSFTKDEMLQSLRLNKNIEQECITSTSIIQSNAEIAIVKISMQYEWFTRSNFVTISNTGKGWKITNVYSVFK
ncbi:nuclear transport factor 2 family protein [Mucilaginibacter lappiensis]|uniref:Uncharacterized protein n=1 Tax=Mucilaginibacter lappiensis TaxID=354630 RepID=A0A1N7G772_9SPHI|nr:nuclear transport factor 2 family protein [Mucilaginibacter lappiensis]MBB6112828.1 hypothetical protein [Mucilaginibacter lappiensis]MBB6131469.1 hypothetical protein [Mucilaginibacter lappiensis]SIS08432.1 Putative lumazine-binding [Mucilaginibacter lappiensis]